MIDQSENEDITIESTNNKTVVVTLLLYCLSGTLLTLVNKLAIVAFPYTNLLLVLQNGVAVILLISGFHYFRHTFGSTPPLNMVIIKLWIPVVLLFVVMLTSSLFALLYVSVPTVIVMRNLSTLCVAALEYIVLGNKVDSLSIATLFGMLLGAIVYAKHDLTFSIRGYTWLCLNTVGTSAYQVYIKKIIDLPLTKDIGPTGMSYYNNLLSLPVLLILASVTGELRTLSLHLGSISLHKIGLSGVVLLSCFLGFSLSTSAFALNKLISATSIMVANNVNKFLVIILSELFIQSTLDITASLGAVFVLFLGWLYSQTKKQFSKPLFTFATIVFVVLAIACEYQQPRIATIGINFNFRFSRNNRSNTLPSTFTMNNQLAIAKEKAKGEEIYKSYLPPSTASKALHLVSPGILIKGTKEVQLPGYCTNKNSSLWKTCDAARCSPYNDTLKFDYPRTTNTGEKTGEFINRVLEVAWGSNPPSVDLYLRSGCNGIMEMKYLFESIEVFWPRFLGSVIVVLDAGDEVILKYLLPANPTHHYVIAFEHPPCFPARVFNQYSYLNLDRHCTADYVVTIDSDCVFHSPVTPDLIFRESRLILASSRTFQGNLWVPSLNAMLDPGMYDGHYMVTQPVAFTLASFSSFRKWFYETKGICYEDRLSTLNPHHYGLFCWMCQLGTYLERAKPIPSVHKQYWYQHLNNASLEPILRYSIHLSYEPFAGEGCSDPKCYEKSANEVMKQGLCRALGSSIFNFCINYTTLAYVNRVTFTYAHDDIQAANAVSRSITLGDYVKRLHNVTKIVLSRPMQFQPRL